MTKNLDAGNLQSTQADYDAEFWMHQAGPETTVHVIEGLNRDADRLQRMVEKNDSALTYCEVSDVAANLIMAGLRLANLGHPRGPIREDVGVLVGSQRHLLLFCRDLVEHREIKENFPD